MRLATCLHFAGLVVTCAVCTLPVLLQAATLIGPLPYFSFTNSPFYTDITNGTMFIETFESGTLSVPGVTGTRGHVAGPSSDTHSVDADDGQIDGKGTNGHSFLSYIPVGASGRPAHTFLFDTNILGHYPTKVGIVVTDSGGHIFYCYAEDSQGELLEFGLAEAISAGTGEGQFFGLISSNGIVWLRLLAFSRSLEVDHLQYADFDPGAGLVLNISAADNVDVCWYGRWNVTHQLQERTNLFTGPWNDLGAPIRGSGSRNCVSVNAKADSQRFYRVIALP